MALLPVRRMVAEPERPVFRLLTLGQRSPRDRFGGGATRSGDRGVAHYACRDDPPRASCAQDGPRVGARRGVAAIGEGGASTMGKKRSKRRDDAVGLDPAPDEAGPSAEARGGGEASDPAIAKRAKALRRRITSLDAEVAVARRRIERRRERLIDAERVLRSLERELVAALREARAEGVEDPGAAAARPTRRRALRPAPTSGAAAKSPPPVAAGAAAVGAAARSPRSAPRKAAPTKNGAVEASAVPPANRSAARASAPAPAGRRPAGALTPAPMPPAPADVTPRATRRRTAATGSRPAGGSRRRPRDVGAGPDAGAGPPP